MLRLTQGISKYLKSSPLVLAKRPKGGLPTRQEQLAALKRDHFDVLVIGGGATG